MGKHFLWDPVEDNIIEEFDDAGNTIADYTTEPYLYGDLISQHRDGQSSFYHYDGQGNTTSLTDSAANVMDTYAYSAFGEVAEHSGGAVNPFQYLGRQGYFQNSRTDSIMSRRREYVSKQGRWICLDASEDGLFDNRFAYCYNRPTILADPSGLEGELCRNNDTERPWILEVPKKGLPIPLPPGSPEMEKALFDVWWVVSVSKGRCQPGAAPRIDAPGAAIFKFDVVIGADKGAGGGCHKIAEEILLSTNPSLGFRTFFLEGFKNLIDPFLGVTRQSATDICTVSHRKQKTSRGCEGQAVTITCPLGCANDECILIGAAVEFAFYYYAGGHGNYRFPVTDGGLVGGWTAELLSRDKRGCAKCDADLDSCKTNVTDTVVALDKSNLPSRGKPIVA